MWDIAVKYAADWNSVKFSAAFGYTMLTDEGCFAPFNAGCSNVAVLGGGGTPFQAYRKDADVYQVGASVLHVPTGLFFYGMWQGEENNGTQWKTLHFKGNPIWDPDNFKVTKANAAANDNDSWFLKAGIKRTFMFTGATVLWGEWGQYNDMYTGLCGNPGGDGIQGGSFPNQGNTYCGGFLPVGVVQKGPYKGEAILNEALITGSEVQRWGVGVVQEIDSAAMHLFFRWQHVGSTSTRRISSPRGMSTRMGTNTKRRTRTSARG